MDALAGNVVIACVADMEPGKAVVAHVGEDRFAPDVEVTPTGELSIRSAPSLASFATQGQRINTLVLAPPDLPRLDLRLAVGNLFVFGTVGVGSSSSGNMGHVSAAMTAGNVVFADVYADRIDAYNRAGDVVLRWDEERDERDVEMWDSFSDPGLAILERRLWKKRARTQGVGGGCSFLFLFPSFPQTHPHPNMIRPPSAPSTLPHHRRFSCTTNAHRALIVLRWPSPRTTSSIPP